MFLPSIVMLSAPSSSTVEVTFTSSIFMAFRTSSTNFSQASIVAGSTFASSVSSLTSFFGAFLKSFSFLCSFLNSFLVSVFTGSFFSACSVFSPFAAFSTFTGFSSFFSAFTSTTGSSFLRALITACFLPNPRKPSLPFSITS